ncbi:hypothetical protein K8942_04165 [Candidatus Peribacteria bacterium]|nr:MAG: hypothetical protein K8942_04165 [Candidatus Peribacteria bacterium]
MSLLATIIGNIIPSASARTLEEAGAGNAGVRAMWNQICAAIPCVASSSGDNLIEALVSAIIAFIFPLTSVIAVCMVIYAGIQIVISNGSEDKVGEAKKIMMYAAAGVILSLMTSAIMSFAVYYLGIILS